METRRWTNPGQPQTLQTAVFLFYILAVYNVLFREVVTDVWTLGVTVGSIAAGLGIASERRWGYAVGGLTAVLALKPVIEVLVFDGITEIFNFELVMTALWPVVLLVLLGHPQSREYQRIWFH